MRRLSRGDNHGGFTLLELLVALAIFSLIAVMAYGGLETVLNQQVRTEENAESLAALQKTYLVMQRDIEQAVPRPIRDEFGDQQGPLLGTATFQLTRGGLNNPVNHPRSTLQRVGYSLEERQLIRYAWPVLDRAQDSAPTRQPLATEIESLEVRYLDDAGNWQEQWPTPQAGNTPDANPVDFPRAVEMTLEHARFGKLTWLFQLPR
jgi:general secretion pathway protein J